LIGIVNKDVLISSQTKSSFGDDCTHHNIQINTRKIDDNDNQNIEYVCMNVVFKVLSSSIVHGKERAQHIINSK